MGLLDDMAKLQWMIPFNQAVNKTLANIQNQKLRDAAVPIIKEMTDKISAVQSKDGMVDPNEVNRIGLQTYTKLFEATRGQLPEAREEVKSLYQSVIDASKTAVGMKHEIATTGMTQEITKGKAEETRLSKITGLNMEEAKIGLANAQADWYRNRDAAEINLQKVENMLTQGREKSKLARELSLQVNSSLDLYPELAKGLTDVNIDDYINEKKIDIVGLAEIAARNNTPNWGNETEEARKGLKLKYRLQLAGTMLGGIEKQQRALDTQTYNLLLKEKQTWESNPMNVQEDKEGNLIRVPFPEQLMLDNLKEKIFPTMTQVSPRDPVLDRSEQYKTPDGGWILDKGETPVYLQKPNQSPLLPKAAVSDATKTPINADSVWNYINKPVPLIIKEILMGKQ